MGAARRATLVLIPWLVAGALAAWLYATTADDDRFFSRLDSAVLAFILLGVPASIVSVLIFLATGLSRSSRQ